MSDPIGQELQREQLVVDAIALTRRNQIEVTAQRAARLADEAAELTTDGLRDIFDEDDDPDAAVQASFVRERAMYAMAAARRFHQVESVGAAPAFGRVTGNDGQALYVGRCSVIEGDEVLLVDWRARAAVPFYRATPSEPLDIMHRRHLHYRDTGASPGHTDDAVLTGYSDEVFSPDGFDRVDGLQGEAALLASLERDTTGLMASVVATIQSEQDAIIRASASEPLLVQGGPGTGKTVVALHRAAYLLYDQRQALAENGVLIVGPTHQFLAYISEVLPSLGETGVVSAVPAQLYPGVRRGQVETGETARIKGSHAMVALLAHAVSDRQRRPDRELVAWYGSDRVVIDVETLHRCFDDAKRSSTHNEGAERLRTLVVEQLARKVFTEAFDNYGDAYRSFSRCHALHVFLLRCWPTLTPEQMLNDLFGSPALLRRAATAAGLTHDERRLLRRERTAEVDLSDRQWSDSDIALLDECWSILGGLSNRFDDADRQRVRDARDEFEIAAILDESGIDAGDPDETSQDGLQTVPLTVAEGLPAPPLRAHRV